MAYRYPFQNLYDVNAPYFRELEQAQLRVLHSGRYIGGPEVENFESLLARQTHVPYAVGVTNGLDALRLIFRAYIELGRLKPGDEVIVPANTYVASVLAVTDNGLKPVFVEPDEETMNLDSRLVENAVTSRTRAVLTVHLYGRVAFDAVLADAVSRHNLLLIEDNAQAIGAVSNVQGFAGTVVTGGLGHAGAFSFYPTKNIGALGDAGAVTTHDKALADAVRALRNYGSDRQYHNVYKGCNCRLDPMKAAQLAVKLPYTDEENALRRCRASVYDAAITNPEVRKPLFGGLDNVWHQYIVRVADRDAFRKYLSDNGVETAVHYAVPPHRQPCYAEYAHLDLPVTVSIADTVVSLPVTRTTSADDAREIAAIINAYSH